MIHYLLLTSEEMSDEREHFPGFRSSTIARIGLQNNQEDGNLILFLYGGSALLQKAQRHIVEDFLSRGSLPRDNHETAARAVNPTLIDTLELFMPRGMCTWFSVRRGTAPQM